MPFSTSSNFFIILFMIPYSLHFFSELFIYLVEVWAQIRIKIKVKRVLLDSNLTDEYAYIMREDLCVKQRRRMSKFVRHFSTLASIFSELGYILSLPLFALFLLFHFVF